MARINSPCKDCEKRGCGEQHSSCEKYQAYRSELDAQRAARDLDFINIEYIKESKRKAEKNVHHYHARKSDRRYH